ncbi:MAG: hypothetical protein A2162_09370 [Deltaproteobacteria bacterium RBG_13_52_11b]|nr:MAG: hypothetical protein A2162_09370 [Deltaproteobacteria bacterium RBG_13_52_11b]
MPFSDPSVIVAVMVDPAGGTAALNRGFRVLMWLHVEWNSSGRGGAFKLLILARREWKTVSCSGVLVKNPKKSYEIRLTLHPLCDISRTSSQARGRVAYVSR